LGSGGAIFVTNIIVFGIWYWELDRGRTRSPGAPANSPIQDFMFPQMDPDTANSVKPGWRPTFLDYLYVSLTNAMAFSPYRHHAAGPLGEGNDGGAEPGGGYHHRARNRKGR
jgi:hypothetical protein